MRILSAVLTLTVAMVVCANAYAADEKAPAKRGPGGFGMMGMGAFLPRDLNLTDAQKSEIEKITKEAREEGEKILTEEQRTAIKEAMEKAKTDKSKESLQALRNAFKLSEEQQKKIAELGASTREKIMGVLTAEQKEKLDKLKKDRGGKRGDRKNRED